MTVRMCTRIHTNMIGIGLLSVTSVRVADLWHRRTHDSTCVVAGLNDGIGRAGATDGMANVETAGHTGSFFVILPGGLREDDEQDDEEDTQGDASDQKALLA